ncbi:AAA-like domain-containing protein [Geminocystis sp. CENA526]|uniref:AAA-like domain-containing protein n=1 Tax=Geminocystis sp. CENA526 TaxID=1355871 RepID=UPI003D6E0169
MNLEDALAIFLRLIKPTQLNDLQELVFKQSWLGKTYQEIASECGYDHDYIRCVGSQLWQTLSDRVNTKVNKHNFRSIIKQYQNSQDIITPILEGINKENPGEKLEIPEGVVPLNSPFYIERKNLEKQCYQEIVKPGSLILIKAPSLFGKTSLAKRIIAHAKKLNYHSIVINFEQADKCLLENINTFLRWFCANVSHQLNLKPDLDNYWDDDLGSKVSCTIYLENYILENLNNPLLITFDQVDILFQYPEISSNFFPLIRFWYEEAKDVEIWQKIRLMVIYSTDIYLPLNINQSPFNVGLSFLLPEFNQWEIEKLCQLHQLNKNQQKLIIKLTQFIGGNPYLIRQAMYHLKTGQIEEDKLIENAMTSSGIYGSHLRNQWRKLQDFPHLLTSIKKIVNSDKSVKIEPMIAYQLEGMGLVKLDQDYVTFSCELYRFFFRNQLAKK